MDENFNKEQVIGFEPLYESMIKCKTGVMWKDGPISFVINGPSNIFKLEKSLKEGTYKERPKRTFTIYEPKRRDVMSFCFRDRVFHRSLSDNAVYPAMSKSFIYDNYASQVGKGPDKARERLKCFLQRYYRKHKSTEGWVLQCDIKGYYPNMRHDVAKNVFRKKLDDWTYHNVEQIIDDYKGDVGFNPGSQIIQIAGISVLDEYDHMVKEKWRVKKYIRFNDDFIMIHENREFLEKCLYDTRTYLENLGFTLNKKTSLYKISDGINFLGFKFILTDTGKVLQFISSDKVKNRRRKMRRMARLVNEGKMTEKQYITSYMSWRNHASKGNNYKLMKRMDKLCHDLLKG